MYNSSTVIWVLVAAFLVYFMQAGFALCEAGLTRAKNTGNILMKNMMDFCIGTPCFWLVGFGIMFAGSGPLIGGFAPFMSGDYSAILPEGVPLWVYAVFQTVFCATAATIVSGSMAERTKFSAYCCYSAAISLIVYPISGHWIWGGGWLAQLGFHDFAGSTAVHFVGGVTACLGAWMLGPRIGKYDKDGKARAIPGHNLTAMALGVFILWFCWFGFNGGSTVAMASDDAMVSAGLVCFNTNLAAALATVAALITSWVRYGKPDVSLTFNGALAGLVAITAGCDMVDPFGAAIIGIVAGVLCIFSVEFFDNVVKIDDPVGAVSVHCMNGMWGTIATGLFSTSEGLLYGHGFRFFGVQVLGVICVAAWVLVIDAVHGVFQPLGVQAGQLIVFGQFVQQVIAHGVILGQVKGRAGAKVFVIAEIGGPGFGFGGNKEVVILRLQQAQIQRGAAGRLSELGHARQATAETAVDLVGKHFHAALAFFQVTVIIIEQPAKTLAHKLNFRGAHHQGLHAANGLQGGRVHHGTGLLCGLGKHGRKIHRVDIPVCAKAVDGFPNAIFCGSAIGQAADIRGKDRVQAQNVIPSNELQ